MILQQILAAMQKMRKDDEVKMHAVVEIDDNGKKKTVAKTLPQILTDLDLSIQDLTDAVEELTQAIDDNEEAERKAKKARRSNRIRANQE
jgi:hypothetical protein